jgi:hypothetical protein
MNTRFFSIALTGINLALLLFIVTQNTGAAPTTEIAPVLRARALELVDGSGIVRAQLNVQDGETVFRLRDAKGDIRVKLGAGEDGSGLVLIDEATEPAIQLIARQTATKDGSKTTSITLKGKGNQQTVLTP